MTTPNAQLPIPNGLTRRGFLSSVAAAGAVSLFSDGVFAPQDLRFAYAAITWQGKDLDAIRDVSALGFPGIQLRSPILKEYGDKPAALKELLDRNKLVMVALSSGGLKIDPAAEKDDLELHTRHARFVKDVGGLYLQVTDTRPKRDLTPDDYKRLGRLMTEIGKRTADIGIPIGYHNHMNNIGERPEEVKWVLDAADPRLCEARARCRALSAGRRRSGKGDP